MTTIRISIITPCLNRVHLIDDAIQSVLRQNYPNVEHIIVDGGSTDGTLDKLAKYPHLKVISEPDKGMYDAINKGIRSTEGEIIGFLNSDDLYSDDVFLEVAAQFNNADIEAVAGQALMFRENEKGCREETVRFSPSPPETLLRQIIVVAPIFNAWFFHRRVFSEIGELDTFYKIAGDTEFMLRFAIKGYKYAILDRPVYSYRQHQDSLTMVADIPKLLNIMDEQLIIAKTYSKRPDISRETQKYLKQLCAQTSYVLSHQYFAQRDLRNGITWGLISLKHDGIWYLKYEWQKTRYLLNHRNFFN